MNVETRDDMKYIGISGFIYSVPWFYWAEQKYLLSRRVHVMCRLLNDRLIVRIDEFDIEVDIRALHDIEDTDLYPDASKVLFDVFSGEYTSKQFPKIDELRALISLETEGTEAK